MLKVVAAYTGKLGQEPQGLMSCLAWSCSEGQRDSPWLVLPLEESRVRKCTGKGDLWDSLP